ncbi:MAG: acyltransferase [Bacteroidales bacterium]|nr:acyltransferase [Bacteroidales bacterium]
MDINFDDFKTLEPYKDEEINPALIRMSTANEFLYVAPFVFPDKKIEEIRDLLHSIKTADEFQRKFMHRAVRRVIEVSSGGLTFDGFDKLDPQTPYLFLTNHRDIVLDSAILQVLLVEHNMPTSEISLGDNLMISPFIVDFAKVNKMFVVYRGGTKIEFLNNSKLLSLYMRYSITMKKHSLWIAQRNGRTKNGSDKTEEALLKMLNLSGTKNFSSNFEELNIVPLSISYEYEPCGLLKVRELYLSRNEPYIKKKGEDLNSIITGFQQPKGRIHLSAGIPINNKIKNLDNEVCNNQNIKELAGIIDHTIYENYKLWPVNYIAYDLLNNSEYYSDKYDSLEKQNFNNFVIEEIEKIDGDKAILKKLYLEMYANPVINKNSLINV